MPWNKKKESVLGRLLTPGVVFALVVVGGCQSPSQIDYSSIRGLGTSGSSPVATVFAPGGLAMRMPGAEDTRRDAALSVQDNSPRLATDEWSRDLRPSLRLQRRGRFTTLNDRSYYYYENESDHQAVRRRGW